MRERNLRIYVACSVVLGLPAVIGICTLGHLDLHLAVNRFHAPWADRFFAAWTHLADGWVPLLLAVVMLRQSWRAFLMVAVAVGGSALVVQGLKHLAFPQLGRPAMYLSLMPGLHVVPGVDLDMFFSFPSGHATAAFSMCLALAVRSRYRWSAMALAVIAASLAYSRVYLSMHFTEDVLAGAALGTVAGLGTYSLLYTGRWGRNVKLDKSPFRRQNQ